jgi:hypothetical protein
VLGDLEPVDVGETDESKSLELAVRPNRSGSSPDATIADIELDVLDERGSSAVSASHEGSRRAQIDAMALRGMASGDGRDVEGCVKAYPLASVAVLQIDHM